MLRVIQAGMGGWGRDWARNVLQPNEEVALLACVDADAASLALARKQLDLPAHTYFETLTAALNGVDAEAVLITASLPGHVPLAAEALNGGKHVLLEKPFAPSVAEARQLVELAEEHSRVLMVSQNYRYFPAVQAVRDLLRSGSLGEVGPVSVDFRRYANTAARQGHRHYTVPQPLLADMAIHHFDLMRAVLGQEPVEIACRAWNPAWSNFEEPAAAFATIAFDGGAVVSYRGSWVSPGRQTAWAGEWHMECHAGEVAWTSRDNLGANVDHVTVKPLGKRARRLELPAHLPIDRAGSLRAFMRAVATGEEPESSGRDNLGSIALVYAAIEAATTGEPVRIGRTG
ncbi:MAG TPA: Gfo/Idh/MocA family oxidoreductase [Chloroflexia bacterium]|nr:Gfo/Idh/MocA family oxidoreductase [Chloroflexia bacterium]